MLVPIEATIGARVIRNHKFWKWAKQDGGEGHLGTVRQLNHCPGSSGPTVVIAWDNGTIANYRCEDVLLVDTGPSGIVHEGAVCDWCHREPGIAGIRWQCAVCVNYDLCSNCYHADAHSGKHRFYRIDTPESYQRILVPPRKATKKRVSLRGILPGAKVVRGIDWIWQNQDGGNGKKGRVIRIQEWTTGGDNSAALVAWTSNGQQDLYRVGYGGLVDLKAIEPAKGHAVYRDHLPALADYVNHWEEDFYFNDNDLY